jgi:hypothetical protein
MNTRTAPDSARCCGFDEGVSCVRDHLARAVMFVRMSRFRLSRTICDADLTSAPFTMPRRDFVVSLSAARFRALEEACSERNAEPFLRHNVDSNKAVSANLSWLHAVMLAMNQRLSDAEARRLVRAAVVGHFHPLFFVPYLEPCASGEPCMVLLRQRRGFMRPLSLQTTVASAASTGSDAMRCSAGVSQAVRECLRATRMSRCTTSPEPRTSAPWLPLHPRPSAHRDWSAPTALSVARCSAGEFLSAPGWVK